MRLPVPEATIHQLRNATALPDQQIADAMVTLFFSRQWRRLRAERVEALVERRSLVARCVPQLAGSPAVTERLTGLKPGMPGYAWQHYVVQPARRVYRNLLRPDD